MALLNMAQFDSPGKQCNDTVCVIFREYDSVLRSDALNYQSYLYLVSDSALLDHCYLIRWS